jgi:hypothetical protein
MSKPPSMRIHKATPAVGSTHRGLQELTRSAVAAPSKLSRALSFSSAARAGFADVRCFVPEDRALFDRPTISTATAPARLLAGAFRDQQRGSERESASVVQTLTHPARWTSRPSRQRHRPPASPAPNSTGDALPPA